jgi:hypothetical protein
MGVYLKKHNTPNVDGLFVDDMIADLENDPQVELATPLVV